MAKIKDKFTKLINADLFISKEKRYKLQLLLVSGIFFVVGVIFSIINIITKENQLLISTGIFSFLSLVTFVLIICLKKYTWIVELFFVASTVVLFSYFLIFGGAGDSGFSTYWILLLPFITMLVLGLTKGTITTFVMFLLIVILLWIPQVRENVLQWGKEMKSEDFKTFYVRFPLVYLAAFVSSFLFELSRFFMEKQNDSLTETLKNDATHDFLTGLTNRHGLSSMIESMRPKMGTDEFKIAGAMLLDIDNFKSANDIYGHGFGDEVLISLAKILRDQCGEWAIRFGGDEFICLFVNKEPDELLRIGEEIRKAAEHVTFASHPDYKYTVSIGVAYQKVDSSYRLERVIELADYQSSRAKKSGKNRVYLFSYDDVMKK